MKEWLVPGIGSRDNRCNYCSVYRCAWTGYQDGGTAGVSCRGWILQCDFRMFWLPAAYFFQSEYRACYDDRTMIIASLAFCIGVGLTQTSGNFFSAFPKEVGDIFNGNAVAGVFVVPLILSLCLPKKKTTDL